MENHPPNIPLPSLPNRNYEQELNDFYYALVDHQTSLNNLISRFPRPRLLPLIDYTTDTTDTNYQDIMNLFNNIMPSYFPEYSDEPYFQDVKITITEDEFNDFIYSFEYDIYHDGNLNSCTICTDDYNNCDYLTKLPCLHYFHTNCIKHWLLSENVTCPICRKDVRDSFF
jgi:hypothetical protein